MKSIPEFDHVTVNSYCGKYNVTFHWGNHAWNASGHSVADCINKMVAHFTK